MKLRIIFLKKVHILYLFLFILLFISLFYTLSKDKNINVFHTIQDGKIVKADLTGDGNEDILYINTENDKYFIQINSKDKSYYLLPDRNLNTLGYYYPFSPMKINLIDISRDRIPEIFIQSYSKGSTIQHVFVWNGEDFIDTFCSYNNIMGFIDSKNNKSPKFASGNFNSSKINLSYYMNINNKIEKIEYEDNLPGKNEIIGFIGYVQSLPYGENNKPVDIFNSSMDGEDLKLIGKLSSENKIYKFIDGTFIDTKFNRNGEATEYKWVLNFKGSPISTNGNSENSSIIVKLAKSSGANNFRIISISANNKK